MWTQKICLLNLRRTSPVIADPFKKQKRALFVLIKVAIGTLVQTCSTSWKLLHVFFNGALETKLKLFPECCLVTANNNVGSPKRVIFICVGIVRHLFCMSHKVYNHVFIVTITFSLSKLHWLSSMKQETSMPEWGVKEGFDMSLQFEAPKICKLIGELRGMVIVSKTSHYNFLFIPKCVKHIQCAKMTCLEITRLSYMNNCRASKTTVNSCPSWLRNGMSELLAWKLSPWTWRDQDSNCVTTCFGQPT